MLKGMTAYGRGSFQSEIGHFIAEIQSVNRKFLDIQIQLPKELIRFEAELRRYLIPHMARGQVSLKIFATFDDMIPVVVHPNLPLARQLKGAWDRIAAELGVPAKKFDLSLLAKEDEIISFESNLHDEQLYHDALLQVVKDAMKGFQEMKRMEGAALQQDIGSRIAKMKDILSMIQEKAPTATKKYREKLLARLEELLPGSVENDERVYREVAIFAEKVDIAEEVTRFSYHLKHALELLDSKDSVGKTFEFVIQEMNREANTIGSKSSDLEITRNVIDIKSELEKIREQIQNVE